MFAKLLGKSTFGIDGIVVMVEVDINNVFPKFEVVGLPTTAVKESRKRVKLAICNSGYGFPIGSSVVHHF